jgi:hypothetical protein
MLRLYDDLCSRRGLELFGCAIMGGGLVLAARPDVAMNEGVIIVRFDPTTGQFSLDYFNGGFEPEQSERCAESDVSERIRLYLAYKLGQYTKPSDAPNQLPDPTSPSVTPPAGAGGAPSVVADH